MKPRTQVKFVYFFSRFRFCVLTALRDGETVIRATCAAAESRNDHCGELGSSFAVSDLVLLCSPFVAPLALPLPTDPLRTVLAAIPPLVRAPLGFPHLAQIPSKSLPPFLVSDLTHPTPVFSGIFYGTGCMIHSGDSLNGGGTTTGNSSLSSPRIDSELMRIVG